MAKFQSRSFIPASILKYAAFLLLAVLFLLLAAVPALADVKELTTDESGVTNSDWNTASCLTRIRACTKGIRFVHKDYVIRTPTAVTDGAITFEGDIYLGYDYDHYDAENNKDVFTISATSGTLALKNSAAATITIGNLYLAKGTVTAWVTNTPTLAGNIIVESSEATIFSQDASKLYISSSIVKNTSDAVLNLTPYEKSGSVGEFYIYNNPNVNCPLNLTKGKICIQGTNTFGSDFSLTIQNGSGAGIIMFGDYLGNKDAANQITIIGSARYVHNGGTVANKVNYCNVLISEDATLNAQNNYGSNGIGAKGSMVFAGDLQGSGTLNIDTKGSTNTNSLTLGHSENSFTGNVTVTTGKLQFTVKGQDNVIYTGTNALINAASVSVASGATIDVGATTQTFKNLSGAGTVTVSAGGSLTLNCTADTIFSGEISSTEEVIKTGNGSLRVNQGSIINCPLNVNQGQFYVNGMDISGSNFALTLQDGTSVLLSGNNLGIADSTMTVNGTVSYSQASGTGANKVNFSNVLITAGSTLNAQNNDGVGARGSIVFGGDLQGSGALVVDTVGSTNTNSLTLGHPENSFTGTVSVNSGKLQFTVLGYDDVTYTGTNALVNAASVAVASGATIDVGTTTQTLNNLSGAGNITLSGGALTLNNTSDTEFAGGISGTGAVTKTGSGTLKINAAQNAVDVESFVVSSGRLDMKEYFKGSLTVEAGATLSPGNSIGKLTVDGEFSLDSGATLLMEVGKNDQGEIAVDQLILSEVNEDMFASGSIINIVLDPDSGLQGGDSFTDLVFITTSSEEDAASIYDAVKNATISYYFPGFEVKQVGNNIVLSGSLDSNAIPEPSTWALLALGVCGLLYLRKRK